MAADTERLKQLNSEETVKRKRHGESESSVEANKRLKPSESKSGGGGGGGGAAVDLTRDSKSQSLPPLSKLSVAGVSDYLRSIAPSYAPYISSFADSGINGAALCKLTDSDLSELLKVSNRLHALVFWVISNRPSAAVVEAVVLQSQQPLVVVVAAVEVMVSIHHRR